MTTAAGSRESWRTVPVVIITGCVASMLIFGIRAVFSSLFNNEVTTDFFAGDPSVFALAIAIQNLLWGLGQPFAGAIADRFGAGRVLFTGALLYGGGVIFSAYATTPGLFYLSAGFFVGFGLSSASFAVVLAAMARMVPEEKRSWALGIGTAAGSLGQLLLVPLGGALKASFGWESAMIILGILTLLLILASVVFAGKPKAVMPGNVDQSLWDAVKEASGHRSYWLLVFGFFVCGFHVTFILVHIQPYIEDVRQLAEFRWLLIDSPLVLVTMSVMFIGGFNIIGSYVAGMLGGKYTKKNLLSSLYMGRAIAIVLLLMLPKSDLLILAFAGVMGLFWLSTVPLTSGLVAHFFGPRYMATLFGFVFFSHQVGAFIGAWLGGVMREMQGDYVTMWWVNVALGLFAALVHLPIREQPVARLEQEMQAS